MIYKKLLKPIGVCALVLASVPAMSATNAEKKTVSIEELQELCHQHRNHEQIRAGSVYFKCKVKREFWVHTGSKPLNLPNRGKLKTKAHIKDQRYSTDFWSVPFEVDDQSGQCEEYEQWVATTVFSQPGSCDLLDNIVEAGSEDVYCRQAIEEHGKSQSRDNAIKLIQENPSNIKKIAKGTTDSIFSRTGEIKSCETPDGPRQQNPKSEQSIESLIKIIQKNT